MAPNTLLKYPPPKQQGVVRAPPPVSPPTGTLHSYFTPAGGGSPTGGPASGKNGVNKPASGGRGGKGKAGGPGFEVASPGWLAVSGGGGVEV